MTNRSVFRRVQNRWTIGMMIALILLCAYFLLILYPLVWMILSSLKTEKEFFRNLWGLPNVWQWQNYAKAWSMGISSYFLNSVFVTASTIALCVSAAALAAFGLSRYKFRGNSLIFVLCMGGMMLSPQVTLIPLYRIIQALHIHDTYWAMVLPYAAYRAPITVMLIRSYFLGIPKEIEESAVIDGCNSFEVLWRIFLPISKPILMTCAILVAYYAWNEFMFSMIFIDSRAYKTIPSGLMVFRDALSTNYAVLFAGLTISAIPMVVVFLLMQKQFIRGMTAGAVKG